MNIEATEAEAEAIRAACHNMIYGKRVEYKEAAPARGIFLLSQILRVFPNAIFKQYPNLEAFYQELKELEK